jgi:hypothetical protein
MSDSRLKCAISWLFVTVAVVLMASLIKNVRKSKAKAEASASSATAEDHHDKR